MSFALSLVSGIILAVSLGSPVCAYSLQVENRANAIKSSFSVDDDAINEVFKEALGKFIADRGFPGAVISIYQRNEMILNEAYGRGVDVNRAYPLASNSKLFTKAAIEKLIQEKHLSRDDKVWKYLHLKCEPKDPRIEDITIGQLLDHKGGWDRESSPDPLFASIAASNQIALIEHVIESTMLDFTPGTKYSYSNFGYLLLGVVIEKITEMDYLTFINQAFAEPFGFQIHQAETPSTYSRNTPFAGAFCLEVATPSLGLAVRAQEMAKIVASKSKSREEPWWLDGSLPGTVTSLVRRRVNDVTIVVFIPDRDDNCWKDDNNDLRKIIDHAANKVGL